MNESELRAALEQLDKASTAINDTEKSQLQITVAALAGAGVIVGNIDMLLNDKNYNIFLYLSVVYLALGLLFIERTWQVALRGLFKNRAEAAIFPPPSNLRWEVLWYENSRKRGATVSNVLSIFRYLPTLGISMLLMIVWIVQYQDHDVEKPKTSTTAGGVGPQLDVPTWLAIALYCAGVGVFLVHAHRIRGVLLQLERDIEDSRLATATSP